MTEPIVADSPIPFERPVRVLAGSALLSSVGGERSLAGHRSRLGDVPKLSSADLLSALEFAQVRGRGGAAFPLAAKVRTALSGARWRRRPPVVVVNAAEGEPGSAKDAALALVAPHLVLDGARAVALALGAPEVHVILPGERPAAAECWRQAMAERTDHFVAHLANGFVGGQARAVLELMAGRPNLPVTAWAPESTPGAGYRGHPTIVANAETYGQVGWLLLAGSATYARLGTREEPGTTLITLTTPFDSEVHEIEYGAPLPLPEAWRSGPLLVGGFHGSWVEGAALARRPVSITGFRSAGAALGAGIVINPLSCPLEFTASVLNYLAGQSARRCGPCVNGLPALAATAERLAHGPRDDVPPPAAIAELAHLVTGRGACAHPDGTARLARSALTTLAREIAAHARSECLTHHHSRPLTMEAAR